MKKYLPWLGLVARLTLGGTLIVAGYLNLMNSINLKWQFVPMNFYRFR